MAFLQFYGVDNDAWNSFLLNNDQQDEDRSGGRYPRLVKASVLGLRVIPGDLVFVAPTEKSRLPEGSSTNISMALTDTATSKFVKFVIVRDGRKCQETPMDHATVTLVESFGSITGMERFNQDTRVGCSCSQNDQNMEVSCRHADQLTLHENWFPRLPDLMRSGHLDPTPELFKTFEEDHLSLRPFVYSRIYVCRYIYIYLTPIYLVHELDYELDYGLDLKH